MHCLENSFFVFTQTSIALITLESCIDNIKQNSRKYAKRQFTWFNRNENIHWIDVENGYDEVLFKSKNLVKDFLTKGEL